MVRHLLQQFTECFDLLETFTGENFFNSRRGVWMHYPHKGNVRIAVDTWRRFAELWTKERDATEAWCQNYFAANRTTIFKNYWISLGANAMTEHLDRSPEVGNPPNSRLPDMHPAFAEPWTEAVRIVEAIHQRKPIEYCNVPEILEIHAGKQCENNGFYCWYCDDMETRWLHKLRDEACASNNIFLSPNARRTFTCPVDKAWTGPPTKPTSTAPRHKSMDGKTPFQAMKAFIDATSDIRFALKDRQYMGHSDHDDFLKVWTHRLLVDALIPLDAARIAEIEALLP